MTKDDFIIQHCYKCGSQRCDGSEEWMNGCDAFKMQVLGIIPEKSYECLIGLKNEQKQGILRMFNHWKEIVLAKL